MIDPDAAAIDPAPPPRGPTTGQWLLGLFIVWQLFFLLAANTLRMIEYGKPNCKDDPFVEAIAPGWTRDEGGVNDTIQVVLGLTKRWEKLTHQTQGWSMFAPSVAEYIAFPAVQLRWDDDPKADLDKGEVLLSDNEPEDLRSFVRFGMFRLRRYESYITVALRTNDAPVAEVTDKWRGKIEYKVKDEQKSIHAYLDWRWRRYQREHPESEQPAQLVLWERVYRVPAPGQAQPWNWSGPEQRPLARWRPNVSVPEGRRAVEMYNPVLGRFEYVR